MVRRKKDEIDGLGAVLTLMIGCIYFPIKIIVVSIQVMILGITLIINGITKLTYLKKEKKDNKDKTSNKPSTKTINISIDVKEKKKTNTNFKTYYDNNKNVKSNLLDEETEKEMEALELEEWQKELVREGEFYTTSFDEEDVDEESYFYEE